MKAKPLPKLRLKCDGGNREVTLRDANTNQRLVRVEVEEVDEYGACSGAYLSPAGARKVRDWLNQYLARHKPRAKK